MTAPVVAGTARQHGLPRRVDARVILLLLVIVCAAAAAGPFVLRAGMMRLLTEIFVVLAMAQMWNLLAGYAGLMSIGHQAFVGVGAYALFAFSNFQHVSPYYALPVAPLLCGVLAAALAPFLFRLRDAYFSIGIWVVAEIIAILIGKSTLLGRQYGMALTGMRHLDRAWFGPITFWLAAGAAIGSMVLVYLILRSRVGLGLMAVRDNDVAAASLGIDVWRSRFIAFVISGAGTGLAGAIYYMSSLQVVPTSGFDPNWVVQMLFITIIGGMGRIEGPILGTIVFFGLREIVTVALGLSAGWYLVGLGTVAIAAMLFEPAGLGHCWRPPRDRMAQRSTPSAGPGVKRRGGRSHRPRLTSRIHRPRLLRLLLATPRWTARGGRRRPA